MALFTGAASGGDIPTLSVSSAELAEDGRISTMLVRSGLCRSQSDARKQIEQNAVAVDNEKITDVSAVLTEKQIGTDGVMIRKGKKGFCRVILA